MAARVTLRDADPRGAADLERLARSRTAQARLVERARIVLAAAEGRRPRAIAATWASRGPPSTPGSAGSTTRGLAGLQDQPRSGRPATYTAEQRAEVVAAALTDPKALGLPFGSLDAGPPPGLPQRAEGDPDQAEPDRRDPRWPRACGGGSRRPGSASGWTPTSPKKGGDRAALHRPAARARVVVCLDEMGPQSAKSFPGQRARPRRARGRARRRPPPRRAGQAGDRLRPAAARGTSSAPSGRRPARR